MKEQIKVAVKWWGNQLRHTAKQDVGDDMLNLTMTALSPKMEITEAQIQQFEELLNVDLLNKYKGNWYEDDPMRGGYYRTITTDYHPEGFLYNAAIAAGMKACCPPFPAKTCMRVDPDKVSVSCGYGAKEEILWTKNTNQ
jgi:hypothetical protein